MTYQGPLYLKFATQNLTSATWVIVQWRSQRQLPRNTSAGWPNFTEALLLCTGYPNDASETVLGDSAQRAGTDASRYDFRHFIRVALVLIPGSPKPAAQTLDPKPYKRLISRSSTVLDPEQPQSPGHLTHRSFFIRIRFLLSHHPI